MEADREASATLMLSESSWFAKNVWPNLFASIIWSLPTWAFIFWRFARRFVKEREEILHRLDEMHRHMDTQHQGIQQEVRRAPPPPKRFQRKDTTR